MNDYDYPTAGSISTSSEAPKQSRSKRDRLPRPTTQMTVGCLVIPVITALLIGAGFFFIRSQASARLTVPAGEVLLVRAAPAESAALLARFGAGHTVTVTGRTEDWRWLEIDPGNGHRGWALRPLDILVWQIDAAPTAAEPSDLTPPRVAPIAEETVAIPAATFTMGSPPGLGEDDERPARPVSLSAFEIDRTEVTVGQYWACVTAGACAPPVSNASQTEPNYINNPAFDNYPVINVAWTEANNYCQWRGKRLPTEAEWEMAAGWDAERGAKSLWPWGNDPTDYQANLGDLSRGDPAPVGTIAADQTATGALDMGGNVSEWVFDWYKVDYYSVGDNTDPIGPTQRRGEGRGRVVRGGSFADPVAEARTANRRHRDETYGYQTVGFRCAKDN